jgi:hypothetical protein
MEIRSRQPAQHLLARARELVSVRRRQSYDSDRQKPLVNVATLQELTPPDVLTMTFPPQIDGTPYAFFSRTDKLQQVVVLVDEKVTEILKARVYREAALGMQDNLAFH